MSNLSSFYPPAPNSDATLPNIGLTSRATIPIESARRNAPDLGLRVAGNPTVAYQDTPPIQSSPNELIAAHYILIALNA